MKPQDTAENMNWKQEDNAPDLEKQETAAVAGPEAIEGIHTIELTKLGQEAKSNRQNRKSVSRPRKSNRKPK